GAFVPAPTNSLTGKKCKRCFRLAAIARRDWKRAVCGGERGRQELGLCLRARAVLATYAICLSYSTLFGRCKSGNRNSSARAEIAIKFTENSIGPISRIPGNLG